MAVLERQNSAVHPTRVKQLGSRGKPEVANVSLAQGVFGGDRRTMTETESEQLNAGEFPKTLTLSVHQCHAYPWTRIYNSLYLRVVGIADFLQIEKIGDENLSSISSSIFSMNIVIESVDNLKKSVEASFR